MLLVDTNIVAYFLIQGVHTDEAQRLRDRDADWRSEAFLMVEFTNVLAASIAARRMTFAMAEDFLSAASALFSGKLARVPHSATLMIAHRFAVSAYDARFLTLADRIGSRLVTEDARLRKAAPQLTQSIAEALAAA